MRVKPQMLGAFKVLAGVNVDITAKHQKNLSTVFLSRETMKYKTGVLLDVLSNPLVRTRYMIMFALS